MAAEKQYNTIQYKPTNLPWCPQIPEHWEVKKVKFLLTDKGGIKIGPFGSSLKLDTLASEGIKVYGQGNVIKNDFTIGSRFLTEEKFNEDFKQYEIIPNDILLTMMGTVGKAKIFSSEYDKGVIDSHLIRLRFNNKEILNELFPIVIENADYLYSQIKLLARGSIMEGLNSGIVKELLLFLPPLPEQYRIAAYLDAKTAQIDNLISQKQQLIAHLREERTATINQAVTKGLNPDAPMKPSGIAWIGDIPEHWEVKRLKYVGKVQGRVGFKGYSKNDIVSMGEGALTIGAKHIQNDKIELTSPEFITWEKYYESPEIFVEVGQILVVQRGSLGKVALIENSLGEATINPSILIVKEILVNPKFLYFFFVSNAFQSFIEMLNAATAVPMISQEQLLNFSIALPKTIEEIDEVVIFIETQLSQFDKTISKIEQEIELIKEYKAALINEVVTGKKIIE